VNPPVSFAEKTALPEVSATELKDGVSHVGAVLSAGEFAFAWTVLECPLCLGRHIHGGGPLDGDPLERLGLRAAHCRHQPGNHPGTYALLDSNPRRSAAVISKARYYVGRWMAITFSEAIASLASPLVSI
jgi:hypothetical protein